MTQDAVPKDWTDAMRAKLAMNSHKGTRKDWSRDNPRDLLRRVREEVGELAAAVDDAPWDLGAIESEAADVANMAMMVADACAAAVRRGEAAER